MKTKRLAALLLAGLMAVSMLSACGRVEEEPLEQPVGSIDLPVTEPPIETTAPTTTEPVTTPAPTTTVAETTAPATTTAVTTTEAATKAETKKTSKDDYTVEPMSATMYSTMSLNVRKGPSTDFDKLGALAKGDEVKVIGRASTGWYQIEFKGDKGYVSNLYITDKKPAETTQKPASTTAATADEEEEEYVDDEETEEYVDTPQPQTQTQTQPQTQTPSSIVANLSTQWIQDNACEYMAGLFTEQRYLDAMTAIANSIANLDSAVYLGDFLNADETEDIAGKIIGLLGTGYCYFDRAQLLGNSTIKLLYYVSTKEEARNMQSRLESNAAKIIDRCAGYSEYNKVKYIYEYLCKNTVYGGAYGGSSYGPIVDGGATCLGYAKATFYLLSKAGLDVVYDVGRDEQMHAWVKVKIGGNWYNVDTTWGDPEGSITEEDPSYCNYDYLCVSDSFIRGTRTVYDLSKYYRMPSATSNDLNWYRLNGLSVDTYDQGVALAKQLIKDAGNDKDSKYVYIRFQFTNESEFRKFNDHFTLKVFQSELVAPITSARKTSKKNYDNPDDCKTYSITYRMRLA